MRIRHVVAAAAAALLALPIGAGAAAAAPPANDTASTATVLGPLPQQIVQDTTEAGTEPLDVTLNQWCGAPAFTNTVWFRYTDDGSGLEIDSTASSYSTGVYISVGDPENGGQPVSCAPGGGFVSEGAGAEYWVVIFSDTVGVDGGTLDVTFSAGETGPTFEVSVDPVAYATKAGELIVSGTYSCSEFPYDGWLDVEATQKVGRLKISGYGFLETGIVCDGDTHDWEALVEGSNGYFSGGKATTVAVAGVCGDFNCYSSDPVEQTVKVRRGNV